MKNSKGKVSDTVVTNQDIEIQIYSLQLARGKINQIIDETNSNRKMDTSNLKRIYQLNKNLMKIFEEF